MKAEIRKMKRMKDENEEYKLELEWENEVESLQFDLAFVLAFELNLN